MKLMASIEELLARETYTKSELVELLQVTGDGRAKLFSKAAGIKEKYLGNKVYLRGLVEMSNICRKNCLYCGIRSGNRKIHRYSLTDDEILDAAIYAWKNQYGSIALQAGEVSTREFTARIEELLDRINTACSGELGITLSLGEQDEDTYRRWFQKGGIRYLLRIESSNQELYKKLHPNDSLHDYKTRIECLKSLRRVGYQVGSGVMIGLPFQTLEHLADDLLWMQEMDLDMVGMGPYVEHPDTPLFEYRDQLLPVAERFDLSLKMTALIRIMMKNINIVAPTALQAIDPLGREKAIKVGANVVMPNITPGAFRNDYKLYENKPCVDDAADDCKNCLDVRIQLAGHEIGYGEHGDSPHFYQRKNAQ